MDELTFDVLIGDHTVRNLSQAQTVALASALSNKLPYTIKGYRGSRLTYWTFDRRHNRLEESHSRDVH